MQVNLNYGRGVLPLTLRDSWDVTIVRKPRMPVQADPPSAVDRALQNPIGCGTLDSLADRGGKVCVLVCDITRPVPNGTILPILIRELIASGFEPKDITVLIATGLHRPNEGEELAEVIGDAWVLNTVNVVNHFAHNDLEHVYVGTTKSGTSVRLDKRFVEADLKIVTGLVEPHFMAGYSGGRKVIAPGIAHADTITTLHNSTFMSHNKTTNCVLDGNPLHAEQLEIVSMIGDAYAVNTVIDEERNLSFVNFGEIVASHLQAVEMTRKFSEIMLPVKYSTIVTSGAGYPLDKTYYQTVKGMVGPLEILSTGGSLIVASECSEGLGSPDFVQSQKNLVAKGEDAFLDSIKTKRNASVDEWQTQMQLKSTSRGDVQLYATGLCDEQRKLTGVRTIESVENAIEESIKKHSDPKVAVVPEGPYVIPFCENIGFTGAE
ncbi:MAG: hypothetical protein CMM33_01280 [Rhodospirillaceae bacterium]|nr:hypothetical protein [Rhodospirillaceae bacterium]